MPIISFTCLVALARLSSTLWNWNDSNKYPYIISYIRGETFSLLPLSKMLTLGFVRWSLSEFRKFSILSLLRIFFRNGYWPLTIFFLFFEKILWFLLRIVCCYGKSNWFVFPMSNWHCLFRIKLTCHDICFLCMARFNLPICKSIFTEMLIKYTSQ